MTDIRFRGERIVYELALMDAQAIYGGAVRDQFMPPFLKSDQATWDWEMVGCLEMTVLMVKYFVWF